MPSNKIDLRRAILPAAASALLLLSGFFARSPIFDAVTLTQVPGISLRHSPWYSAVAPLSNIFDGLTLLSLPQVFSAFGFVCVIAAVLRARSTSLRKSSALPPYRGRDHLRFGANVIGAIIAVSGLALLMPRPTSALRTTGDELTIDFHSHTSASHDGRPAFTPEANREWHRKTGFDVAYISDHHTFAGALAGMQANPRVAGEGTILLPALEYRDADEHVIALGLDPATTNPERREWHPMYASENTSYLSAPALLILSLPGDVTTVPADEEIGVARLGGIEISDGSPRGIEQAADDRDEIVAMARRRNLAILSGSDNHGWGHTAAAWSVMRIPGWRQMSPIRLDAAIRTALFTMRGAAVQVISRRAPVGNSVLSIALTGPELGWEIVSDIGWPERFAWVGWIWAGWGLVLVGARRRQIRRVDIPWSLRVIDASPVAE
jgi:hypothetical protein